METLFDIGLKALWLIDMFVIGAFGCFAADGLKRKLDTTNDGAAKNRVLYTGSFALIIIAALGIAFWAIWLTTPLVQGQISIVIFMSIALFGVGVSIAASKKLRLYALSLFT